MLSKEESLGIMQELNGIRLNMLMLLKNIKNIENYIQSKFSVNPNINDQPKVVESNETV